MSSIFHAWNVSATWKMLPSSAARMGCILWLSPPPPHLHQLCVLSLEQILVHVADFEQRETPSTLASFEFVFAPFGCVWILTTQSSWWVEPWPRDLSSCSLVVQMLPFSGAHLSDNDRCLLSGSPNALQSWNFFWQTNQSITFKLSFIQFPRKLAE